MKCKDGDCALYYAELSNDNNELIYGFNCEDNPDCYFKQLQRAKAENEHIKESYNSISDSFMKLRKEEWDCYYLASTIKSIFEGARGATEQALKQTTLEKVMYYVRIADRYLHFHEDTIKREIKEKNNKYKQALEEVKNECIKPLNEKFSVNDFLNAKDEELTEVGIIQRNILKIINEVLNDTN